MITEEPAKIAIGKRIREARKRIKLNQTQVASLLSISKSSLAAIEVGFSEVSATRLLKICKLYKTSPNEFLGWRGN